MLKDFIHKHALYSHYDQVGFELYNITIIIFFCFCLSYFSNMIDKCLCSQVELYSIIFVILNSSSMIDKCLNYVIRLNCTVLLFSLFFIFQA